MYKAFVVMPFAKDFDGVWEGIEECLEDRDFEVERADTQQTRRSILKNVIVPLATFDLVIADLTGLNPNFMYELGIAHALDKPVVLISQSRKDLPFDLDKYEVMEYSPKLGRSEFGKFLDELGEQIDSIESIKFGSPISDYLEDHEEPRVNCHRAPDVQEEAAIEVGDESSPGFLDNAEEIQQGFDELVASFEKIGEAVNRMNEHSNRATEMIEGAQSYQGPEVIRRARMGASVAAQGLRIFREESRGEISRLSERWGAVDEAVQGVIDWEKEHAGPGDEERIEQFARDFQVPERAARELLPTLVGLRDSIRGVHGFDRGLNREIDQACAELDRLVGLVREIADTLRRAEGMTLGG